MEFEIKKLDKEEVNGAYQEKEAAEEVDFTIGFNDGFGVVTVDGEPVLVKEGERLCITCKVSDLSKVQVHREGVVSSVVDVVNELEEEIKRIDSEDESGEAVYREYSEEELKEELKRAKQMQTMVTFSDYLYALMLTIKSLRFSDKLFPKLAKKIPLPVLEYASSKISKLYITWIVYLVGLSATLKIAFDNYGSTGIIISVVVWSLIAGFILTPLIYALALPRPIKDYFVDEEELSDEERKAWEKAKSRNPRMERLKKRYGKMGGFGEDET